MTPPTSVFIRKQGLEKSIVVVAVELLPTLNMAFGDEEAIPMLPSFRIVKAGGVDVADVS